MRFPLRKNPSVFVSLVAFASMAHAQGALHVVDDDPGPGVDFGDIQDAIDAASSGDLVLVKDGSYSAFTVANTSLSIIGEEEAEVFVDGVPGDHLVLIHSVGATDRVLIRGLTIRPPDVLVGDVLRLENSAGLIWIEEVQVVEAVFSHPFTYSLNQLQATRIANCDEVILSAFGTHGSVGGVPITGSLEVGSIGMRVENSTVHMSRTVATTGFNLLLSSPGRPGVEVVDSFVSATDCNVTGGNGGLGNCFTGQPARVGGPAVDVTSNGTFTAIGGIFSGGIGGDDGCDPPLPDGPSYEVDPSSLLIEHAATPVRLRSNRFVRDQDLTTFRLDTDPGSSTLLLIQLQPNPLYIPAFPALVATGPGPLLVDMGVTDAAGEIVLTSDVPSLPRHRNFYTYTFQALTFTSGTGFEWSNPTQMTVLQEVF